ncbi:MAG TPA: hemolysin family protein [Thermoanaerobaculia bacterium]|nr:hemolysin family protein [Thermoanaerobaculia bacterium]
MSPFLFAAATPPGPAFRIDPWWALVFGFLLVLLNGFFVAAEFALVKVRPTQIEPHVVAGQRRARVAQHMVHHLDAYLSATQLGITLASLALGWIGEPAFAWVIEPVVRPFTEDNPELLHSIALTVSFATITILHIVLGELAPKSLAIRKAEGTTLLIALPLYVFFKVSYPVIWVLNHAANALLRVFGIAPVSESELAHDEEELRLLLGSAHSSQLPLQKRELLDNIFELSHRMARQIMLPRQDVIYLSTAQPLAENLRIARRSGHTRFPLCEGDLDHVVGVVHIKDIFRRERPILSLQEVARPIAFVPETLELDRLLKRMRTERFQMAAVIDEYGGVSGVVTLEDVLEEIVGPIEDEFDTEKPEILEKGPGVWEISGGMLVEDLEEILGTEFSERDEDTIGGVVLSELGRNPAVGDRVDLGPVTIEVSEVQHNRVNTVLVTVNQPATVPDEGLE